MEFKSAFQSQTSGWKRRGIKMMLRTFIFKPFYLLLKFEVGTCSQFRSNFYKINGISGRLFNISSYFLYLDNVLTTIGNGSGHISGRFTSPFDLTVKARCSAGGSNCALISSLLPLGSIWYHPILGRNTAVKPWRQNRRPFSSMLNR